MADTVSRRAVVLGLAGVAACRAPAAALPATGRAQQLITAARRQVGVTLAYDPAYTQLAFPGGDVGRAKGVCTDVVIRAYRDAFGIDLQALVNADMKKAFAAYPRKWGLRAPDANIDHRRVPNLQVFLNRAGAALPVSAAPNGWRPGDVFTSSVDGRPHIGIVSDVTGWRGRPVILHNIGAGTREEDRLFDYPLTGHYRWKV